MKIYTRGGDQGMTSMLGGERVKKSEPRIDAYGTVDELNSSIGVVRALWPASPIDEELFAIQNDLFEIGAQLASVTTHSKFPGVDESRTSALEHAIDAMESELQPLTNFVLPGGSLPAAQLHIARTVCRRAERLIVSLGDASLRVSIAYINRLSDFLFVAARYANAKSGVADVVWTKK